MFPEHLTVSVTELGDDHLIALCGELDLASADTLRELIEDIAGSTVIVDVAELTFIDAAGLSALIRARQTLNAHGDSLVVRGLDRSAPVRRVTELAGATDIFGGA